VSHITDPSSPPLLVGRERELAILRQHLDAAISGHGSLVLISGEAGAGKTSLAETITHEAAERGALVLIGRCFDMAETPAYGPFLYLFERYRPDIALVPPPAAFAEPGVVGAVTSQAALFRQVLDFLRQLTTQRTVALLLEDLHWFDPASLDLLRALAHSAGDLRLLLLATYRVDELTRKHPLYPLIPVLVRESRAQRIDLHPLDREAVRALVDAQYRLPKAVADRLVTFLHARAEGNAFFLAESLRSLEEDGTLRRTEDGWALGPLDDVAVPPLLRQVIDARVARLSDETQRLLAVAAVVGQEVSYAVWAAVAEVEEDALLDAVTEAETAHVLTEDRDGNGATFTHALLRDAVYESIRPSRRRRWHRATAEALMAVAHPDADAVAGHLRRAGDGRAAAWLITAGERAERLDAWLTAAERYEAAEQLLDARDAACAERGWLLARIGVIRRFAATGRGLAALNAAAAIAATTGDHLLAATVGYYRGIMLSFSGYPAAGIAQLCAAADAFAALSPEEDARRATNRSLALGIPTPQTVRGTLTLWFAHTGRYREAIDEGERVTADVPPASGGDREVRKGYADAMLGLMRAYAGLGLPERARRAFVRTRDAYHANGSHALVARVALDYLIAVALPYETEAMAEHDAVADEGYAASTRTGGVVGDLPGRFVYAPLLVLRGEWHAVRSLVLPWLEASPLYEPWAASILGPLAREQGNAAFAARLVREALPDGPETAPGDTWFREMQIMQRLAAALALDARDLPTARAWLVAHDRWLASNGAVLGRAEGDLGWAAYHRQAGDAAAARNHAERAIAYATTPRQPLVLLAAHRVLGELATDAARYEDADAHLQTSLAHADACAAPYERALSLLAIAELHAATGQDADALPPLDEVRAVCTALGAPPVLARADALAARLTPVHASASRRAGLTAREIEVLRLLAGGTTIRQIADELCLSPRTVERHITTIYRKIGARGRVDATAYAVAHGLIPVPRHLP
jgi:DNA-binding CsgD family transcriptional regulator